MPSEISYAWKKSTRSLKYVTGISLHSHTNESRENLTFLDDLGRQMPLLGKFIGWQRGRAERAGYALDWKRGYWTPPLTPALALGVERRQIEQELQMEAIVSLTDHDSIAAATVLNSRKRGKLVPISCEWTVPFGDTAFHIGVHNLPSMAAPEIMGALASYTAQPTPEALSDLLSSLHGLPNVLVVFNHPVWNLYRMDPGRFPCVMEDFLRVYGPFLHAFELNGLRSWRENYAVVCLASKWRKPLVAGGDRHGCEPNANLNLTHAEEFTDFVREIRVESVSHILYMPQYQQHQKLRCFRTFVDVVRHAPDLPAEVQHWDQRVFHPDKSGVDCSLAALWDRPPAFLDKSFAAVSWLESTAAGRRILSCSSRSSRLTPLENDSLGLAP